MRKIANLLLLCTSITFCLVSVEIGLRLFLPQNTQLYPPGFYTADPELGFILARQQSGMSRSPEWQVGVATNSLGLRERELRPKTAGEFRLLVLGDSFTFGLGVEAEEAYPRRVEEALRLAGHPQITVVNAGVPAYGTRQEAIWCDRIVDRIQPDAILIGFYVNDFDDNLDRYRYRVIDGYLVRESDYRTPVLIPPKLKVALLTRFHLYVLLMNAWRTALVKAGWADTERMLEIYKEVLTPDTKETLLATREALAQLVSCSRNIRHGLVFIPDGRVAKVLGQKTGYRFERPGQIVGEMATAQGVPFLDLSTSFEQDKDLYFAVDGHLNARGHLVASRVIAKSLLEGELSALFRHGSSEVASPAEQVNMLLQGSRH